MIFAQNDIEKAERFMNKNYEDLCIWFLNRDKTRAIG